MAEERRAVIDIIAAADMIAAGQKETSSRIKRLVAAGELPHSILLCGPEGAGKELLAVKIAAWLNCESPPGDGSPRCNSCGQISRLEHPDLHPVYPVPYGPLEKTVPELLESRREDFFNCGEFGNRARSIGIDQIREVIEAVSKQPYQGKRSVVILFEAHLATREAQNAFLKLLEEPPSSTQIILVTEYPHRLLPTIISRCQRERLNLPAEECVEKFLGAFYSLEKGEARRLTMLAEGNIRRCIRFLDERFLALRKDALSLLGLVFAGKAQMLPAEAEGIARSYSREEVIELCEEMIIVLGWLMRERAGGEAPGGTHPLKEEMGKEARRAAASRAFPEDIGKISQAAENLRRHADVELTVVQLLLDLAGKWY
ncbi:MAG: AAA family ATPase [Candidatus Krumholzibacteriota bacterium]|nr:AAA family ATPase [Candidatus Krumholzibacteriota bacterium]